jgi:hypothetical protein
MPDDRRKEVHAAALDMFNAACTSLGLTDVEVTIIAAQFLGRVIAKNPAVQSHGFQLQIAAGAMLDAHKAAMAVRKPAGRG